MASLNVYFRTRRMWLARIAALTGSERLFAWAVAQFRVDMRTSERRPWEDTGLRATYQSGEGRIAAPWLER